MEFETVTDGLQFPEGPIIMADGSVVLVEIRRGTLTRVWPDGRKDVVADLGGGPNGAAVGPDGKIYVCNNGGLKWIDRPEGIMIPFGTPDDYITGSIQRVDPETGAFETVYDSCDGVPLRGPNDIVFDRNGGFYFTDLGKGMEHYQHHGAIYYALPDGSRIVRVKSHLITPNGIGLSPDEKTLYVAETRTSRLWGFNIVAPGEVSPPVSLLPGTLIATFTDYQLLDSMAVQADGGVCIATLVRGGVSVVDSGTGDIDYHDVPDEPYVTNICFGGDDMRDAWITASGRGHLFKTRWPSAGLKLNFNA